jgi:Leucine-rich repeat (LRR) protein
VRFRFSSGRVALTDWLLGGELSRLEAEAHAAVERYREASRRALLRKLQELRVQQTRIPGPALAPFSLKYLDLNYDRTFNDQGMASLKSMAALSKLYLRGTSITDLGLKNLSGLTSLTELDLADTGITDTGLSYLAGLTKLRRLNLRAANVSDAGLDSLAAMTGLEELSLYRTKVSNAGLAKVAELKRLRALDLRYSRATNAGVRELVAGVPNCKVLFLDSSNRESKRETEAASDGSTLNSRSIGI